MLKGSCLSPVLANCNPDQTAGGAATHLPQVVPYPTNTLHTVGNTACSQSKCSWKRRKRQETALYGVIEISAKDLKLRGHVTKCHQPHDSHFSDELAAHCTEFH